MSFNDVFFIILISNLYFSSFGEKNQPFKYTIDQVDFISKGQNTNINSLYLGLVFVGQNSNNVCLQRASKFKETLHRNQAFFEKYEIIAGFVCF